MPTDLGVNLSPERLDEGTPEERAAFGLFAITTNDVSLTEGFDYYINANRQGPLVSGYHAAEWFAWNWWRLLCESRSAAPDWLLAHSMTSIGDGYIWPNITIFSDGLRTALVSSPSSHPDAKPFRYIGGTWAVVPSLIFEEALDTFMPRIIGRLREEKLTETNLNRLWRDVLTERKDPDVSKRRRLEALLGREPDTASDVAIDRLLEDAKTLGESAIGEVAADSGQYRDNTGVLTAADFMQLAKTDGFAASQIDVVRVSDVIDLPRGADVPAWRLGATAATAVRKQEHLGLEPIRNGQLAEMAGISEEAISDTTAHRSVLSFALDTGATGAQIVLRSKWSTGRRFDLARLIGDRLVAERSALRPATRAYTYRQKAQRSFAAELLSPFAAVDEMVAGDYSLERQQDVAEHFDVSPLTINTLLRNHGRVERDVDDYVAMG